MSRNDTSHSPSSWGHAPIEAYSLVEGNVFLMRLACMVEELDTQYYANLLTTWFTTDTIAFAVCAFAALWLLRRLVSWRPQAILSVMLAWCIWFLCDLCCGRGPTAAIEDVARRGSESSLASHELARCIVKFVSAWLSFLVPFFGDACAVASGLWASLTPRQRLFVCSGALAVYATVEACHAVYRRSGAIKRIVFQASFLVVGPCIWLASGLLPNSCLPWLVSAALSGAPTLASFYVSRNRLRRQHLRDHCPANAPPSSIAGSQTSCLDQCDVNPASAECCEVLLSFWACWPALILLDWGIQEVHHVVPHSTLDNFFLQSGDLQRALLVFALWLQLWKGSRLLNLTLHYILNDSGIIALCGALKRVVGAMLGALPGFPTIVYYLSLLQSVVTKHDCSWKAFVMLACVSFLVLTWVFYSALSLVCGAVTLLTLCFVAADTAHMVSKGTETLYSKRLSFWVLAQLWDLLSQFPVAGAGLTLLNPVAFSLFLLAGDRVLEWLVIPISIRLEMLPATLLSRQVGVAPKAHLGTDDGEPKKGQPTGPSSRTRRFFPFSTSNPGMWRYLGMLSGAWNVAPLSFESAVVQAVAASRVDGLLPTYDRNEARQR